MRKALLTLLTFTVAIGLAVVLGARFVRQDNAYRVKRARGIVDELQRLEISKSDRTAADSIAAKFGNAPPPKWLRGRYNKENCAAPNHLERCSYIILMNDSPVETLVLKHQSLPRLGLPEWWGNAQINMSSGTVENYSFWVWYKASNGHWRGFGARVSKALPKFEPVLAHISDSYSVQRIDMRGRGPSGFGLESTITPAANADERQRALHIDFSCLAQGRGCGEICEVMPEAWKDFYEKLGHLDVETLRPGYLACSEPPK